jgi:hypothetical protein
MPPVLPEGASPYLLRPLRSLREVEQARRTASRGELPPRLPDAPTPAAPCDAAGPGIVHRIKKGERK